VNDEPIGTGLAEAVDPVVRPLDHQVHVERQPRRPPQVGDRLWPEREVRHEVPVHHVDVQPLGAGTLDGERRLRETREIR
jgi:hypothetical protein